MRHWMQESTTQNPGVDAAEKFAKYFIVEDDEGSILRDDLYTIRTSNGLLNTVTRSSPNGHFSKPLPTTSKSRPQQ